MTPDRAAKLAQARVAVIGDVMIDEYLTGRVDRISPEAPVPVVRGVEVSAAPGGAANVAANVAALGGQAWLVGVVGRGGGARTRRAACGERPRRRRGSSKTRAGARSARRG